MALRQRKTLAEPYRMHDPEKKKHLPHRVAVWREA